jgi:nucleoside-diphosphate-sugar epimerase
LSRHGFLSTPRDRTDPTRSPGDPTNRRGADLKVLVTGAAGFIGSTLSEHLISGGHSVVGLDAFIPYYPRELKVANLERLRHEPSFDFHELDLRTSDLTPSTRDIDAVVHAAATPGLARSWTEIDLYASCNVSGTQRLLDAATRAQVSRFVHVSTSSVYGREAVGNEDLPLRPISPYGVTKLAAEHLVRAYRELYGLPAVILRYFSIYGPRQRPDMAYNIITEALLDRRAITVYGDGSQSRSSTYVDDCVRGTLGALESGVEGEVYNIGGGEELSLSAAIEILADAVGVEPELRFEPSRPGDQQRTVADTSKARRDFGFAPRVAPDEGLRLQAEWQSERRRRS